MEEVKQNIKIDIIVLFNYTIKMMKYLIVDKEHKDIHNLNYYFFFSFFFAKTDQYRKKANRERKNRGREFDLIFLLF